MIWTLLPLLALVALWPFWRERGRRRPDPKAASGRFADLPRGRVHYRWLGPARGPVIVAIHGLTTPSEIWEPMAERLGLMGWRVLVYDLWGRGASDAAPGRQDRAFFLEQLDGLREALGLAGELTLMGHGMGGAIAAAYAADHPDKVERVILVAPTGIAVEESRLDRFMRDAPFLGDWLMLGPGRARMARALRAEGRPESLRAATLAQLSRRGFLPAVLSSRRHFLMESREADHRAISRAGIPVLAVWGTEDRIVPNLALGRLAQWNRVARQDSVPGAGHALPVTHSTETVARLREMLRDG